MIFTSGKAKYFLFWGLTKFPNISNDLPVVGSICRDCGTCELPAEAAGEHLKKKREADDDCGLALSVIYPILGTATCGGGNDPR